jgi:hypothetical protein
VWEKFYDSSDLMAWPVVGLGIFFLAFLAVLFYVFVVMRRNPDIDRIAALPLENDHAGEEESRDD